MRRTGPPSCRVLQARDVMRQIPRTPKHARASFQTADSESALRDQMLIALTDRALMLQIAETTHGAASWSSSAHSSSQRELQEGIALIDAERVRLEERLAAERARQGKLGSGIARAASEATCERLLCRLR